MGNGSSSNASQTEAEEIGIVRFGRNESKQQLQRSFEERESDDKKTLRDSLWENLLDRVVSWTAWHRLNLSLTIPTPNISESRHVGTDGLVKARLFQEEAA